MCLKRFLVSIAAISLLFAVLPAHGQDFLLMTDQQRIELALDKLRKGVQQEDTTRILMVLAANPSMKGAQSQSRQSLAVSFQTVFSQSSKRAALLPKPTLTGQNNRLQDSDFWDFDILRPVISISGDSAFVDCELVLWGASSAGVKTKERFLFVVPKSAREAPLPDGYRQWPASPTGGKSVVYNRPWRLAGFQNLLDFLQSAVIEKDAQDQGSGGQKP
jgi:hypothetical protein